jgi:hypothetical protein
MSAKTQKKLLEQERQQLKITDMVFVIVINSSNCNNYYTIISFSRKTADDHLDSITLEHYHELLFLRFIVFTMKYF